MIHGGYASTGGVALPRVVTLSIAPRTGNDRRFEVRWHEEGTPIAWADSVSLSETRSGHLEDDLETLRAWSSSEGADADGARRAGDRLGRTLFDVFVGERGADYLAEHGPTAFMVEVDEWLIDLPWELMGDAAGPLSQRYPFGRVVTTRTRPRPERDPTEEDDVIRVLVVVDPTRDLGDAETEIAAVRRMADLGQLEADVLTGDEATHAALADRVAGTRYDVLHLSCHGGFSTHAPGSSGLLLADGPLLTDEILELPFAAPPYLAFTSACWSTRAGPGRRLQAEEAGRRGANGVAAAFLAAGASSVAGFGWPVTVRGASVVSEVFYSSLVQWSNVGAAVLDARQAAGQLWTEHADVAAVGFTFYGDVGTAHRRDLHRAEPPDPGGPPAEAPATRRDIATAS